MPHERISIDQGVCWECEKELEGHPLSVFLCEDCKEVGGGKHGTHR